MNQIGNNISIWSVNSGVVVLDIGLYNNILYGITAEGRVLTKYFNRDSFHPKDNDLKNNLLESWVKAEWHTIMDLEAFPLDSIVSDNELLVVTTDDVYKLPLSLNYREVKLNSFSRILGRPLRSIAISKWKNTFFFSQDTDGLSWYKKDIGGKRIEFKNIYSPSTQTLIAKGTLLNLHPDQEPYTMSLNTVVDKNQDSNNNSTALCRYDEEFSGFSKVEGIIGQDIIAPYTDGRIFALPTYKCNGKLLLNKSRKNETFNRNSSFFYAYATYLKPTQSIECQGIKQNPPEVIQEFPLSILHHPLGIVEEYFDHVDFVDLSGKRYVLIEDSEIAQVRTYNEDSAYSSLITVAAESGGWIFDIFEQKGEADVEIITFQE